MTPQGQLTELYHECADENSSKADSVFKKKQFA